MSNSYKKAPVYTDVSGRSSMKASKKISNKKIRNKLKNTDIDVSNGAYYKSFGLNRWDIYEYRSYKTKQDVINEWEQEQKEIANGVNYWTSYTSTLDEAILEWKKWYKNK